MSITTSFIHHEATELDEELDEELEERLFVIDTRVRTGNVRRGAGC